jgi:uncharacterized cupredoxin-like copper-binding protein
MRRRTFFLLPVLLVAACAGQDTIGKLQPSGYLQNAEQIVAQTDWSNPETTTVILTNHAFTPNVLKFPRNRALRLVLENHSNSDHTFEAEQWFKTIAAKAIVSPVGTEDGFYLERIVVPPRSRKELLFVQVRVGHYPFHCDIPGHSLLGMKGAIDVI